MLHKNGTFHFLHEYGPPRIFVYDISSNLKFRQKLRSKARFKREGGYFANCAASELNRTCSIRSSCRNLTSAAAIMVQPNAGIRN